MAQEDPNRSGTAKRPRDDAVSLEEIRPIKRRVALPNDVLYRIMLPSRHIGKVIGKEGSRIQKLRESTKATIKIADAISRHEERVIIISSKDSENIFCDAEIALHQIASLILKDDHINTESLKVGAGHVAANTLRLLIAGTQAGGLIGVSGTNIEKLRISSGATITVLAPNQMPACASAHESDRVVQISGDVPAVLKALIEMGCQLRDNPPKQVISISPSYTYAYHQTAQQFLDPSSAEYVTMEMMISEAMVGGLIGRCGSNISRIRTESGATIKVHGGKGEDNLRQIHLGGSAQQVALAKQRIDEYMYSQLIQGGGQQSGALDAGMVGPRPPMFMSSAPIQRPPIFMPPAPSHGPPMFIPPAPNHPPVYYPPFPAPQL